MRKNKGFIALVLLISVLCVVLVGCSDGKDKDIYPAWVYLNAWEDEQEELEMPDSANLRIMSYNILVEAWNSRIKTGISSPMNARVEQVGKTINHYSPDVVGLQEVCEKWHRSLPNKIEENYSFVDSVKGNYNYTSMIYNHNKVNLLDCGKEMFTNKTDKKMRYSAWALFEKKDTKQKFVVINTHFDFGEEKKDKQISQMEEFSSLGKKLHEKYNAPVFLTGDYNVYEKEITDKKSPIYEGYQGVDLYDKFVKDNLGYFTDTNYDEQAVKLDGDNRKYDEPKWDHIFVTNDVTTYKYVILSNDFYTSASDHFPVFVDVAI